MVQALSKLGLDIIRNYWLKKLRQLMNLIMVIVCIVVLVNTENEYEWVGLVYVEIIIASLYFLYNRYGMKSLNNLTNVDDCWSDDESLQVDYSLYMFFYIMNNLNLYLSLLEIPEDQKYFRYFSIAQLIIDMIINGNTMFILCAPLFAIISFGIAVIFIIFLLIFICRFIMNKCCGFKNKENLEDPKEKLESILNQVSWIYSPRNKSINTSEIMCPICLDTLEGKSVIRLDCSKLHIFHKYCMSQWLIANNICPLCRMNIVSEELHTELNSGNLL